MKKLLKKPQSLFIILAVFMMILGYYKQGTQLDFSYFLSFLLVDVWSVALISAVFFILISINYASLSLAGKKPLRFLTIAHVLLQIFALISLVYYMIKAIPNQQTENLGQSNIILLFSFIIFIISVLIHLINFFYSLTKQNNS